MTIVARRPTGAWPVAAGQRGIPVPAGIVRVVRGLVAVNESASLESLLTRAGNGSRDDFTALYDRVAAMVYGIALRVVRDPSRAEDVAQESLIDVWRKAPNFEKQRAVSKARNFCDNFGRAALFSRFERPRA